MKNLSDPFKRLKVNELMTGFFRKVSQFVRIIQTCLLAFFVGFIY